MAIITISYVTVFMLVRKRIVALSNRNFDEEREVKQLVVGSYQSYKSIAVDSHEVCSIGKLRRFRALSSFFLQELTEFKLIVK